ncbi:hypothetical protein [Heyndrickxia coagulans]|uniref:Uncharacterized protein n=1 Tax=Heyndrickxia coagulans DSM 1 = ATCC 7050 TaxID=1121088 RepID=A0A8B4BXB6_HEYCO|nr:hypothetical protein [Heyndrickxia coagulans]AJH77385.1 hypothetical protein BF29_3105 [Heyndrickxia coagulans DSM 1 = ATCC 7050]MCR2847593.1 hypothetical protein [Heyndrickxia coagulans]MDR4225036.1 hypothetical protein [Heyndrickxia coagulans DSM 1 = ATCC 7050]MED4406818.1 hypothetical protein [Heyndrickxia coagulans]MED4495053.1 hypothetical protein [Heyndrickxia coagulans]
MEKKQEKAFTNILPMNPDVTEGPAQSGAFLFCSAKWAKAMDLGSSQHARMRKKLNSKAAAMDRKKSAYSLPIDGKLWANFAELAERAG